MKLLTDSDCEAITGGLSFNFPAINVGLFTPIGLALGIAAVDSTAVAGALQTSSQSVSSFALPTLPANIAALTGV